MKKQKNYEYACKTGNINEVKKLLPYINIKNDKYIGFINSCINGHLDIIKLHIMKNINIHINKDEPFVQACRNNHLHLAKYLYNLDPNGFKNIIKSGIILDNPNSIITLQIPMKTINWLLNNFGPNSNNPLINTCVIANKILFRCAEIGNVKIFSKIINTYNIDLEKCNAAQDILFYAARNYRYNIIKYLLEKYNKKINFVKKPYIDFLLNEYKNNTSNGKHGTRDIVKLLIKHNIIDKKSIIKNENIKLK